MNMKVIEGNLSAAGQKIGIVAARFNEFITSRLLGGAEDSFLRHGGKASFQADMMLWSVSGL